MSQSEVAPMEAEFDIATGGNVGDYNSFIPSCLRHDNWGLAAEMKSNEDWEEPVAMSGLPKLINGFTSGMKRRLAGRRQRRAAERFESYDDSQTTWAAETPALTSKRASWSTHPAVASRAENRDSETDLPRFTDPLLHGSLSLPYSHYDEFLSRLLCKRRGMEIHPENKHNLAMFLVRICDEASFTHILRHAPARALLLRLESPDQIEFNEWVQLIGCLRRRNELPGDRKDLPSTSRWFEEADRANGDVTVLRQVAVHRWDYDSGLIEDVVSYLGMLGDESRRRQVSVAVQDLYHSERTRALREDGLDAAPAGDAHQVEIPNYILSFINQGPRNRQVQGWSTSDESSTTLVNNPATSGSQISEEVTSLELRPDRASRNPTQRGHERGEPNATAAAPVDLRISTPHGYSAPRVVSAIAKPLLVTTYHHLLSAYQDSLETCLFEFIQLNSPSTLIRSGLTSPVQFELQNYELEFGHTIWAVIPNQSREHVRELLHSVREIRNATAHRHECPSSDPAPESSSTGWATGGEFIPPIHQYSQVAEEIATILDDDATARKLRLFKWVADINLRATAEEVRRIEENRSVLEWEELEKAARDWRKSCNEEEEPWVHSRLWRSVSYFQGNSWKAMRGLVGEEAHGIFEGWERARHISVTDPRW